MKQEQKNEAMAIKDGTSVLESGNSKKKENHFEKENSIVANVVNNLTCSMRF